MSGEEGKCGLRRRSNLNADRITSWMKLVEARVRSHATRLITDGAARRSKTAEWGTKESEATDPIWKQRLSFFVHVHHGKSRVHKQWPGCFAAARLRFGERQSQDAAHVQMCCIQSCKTAPSAFSLFPTPLLLSASTTTSTASVLVLTASSHSFVVHSLWQGPRISPSFILDCRLLHSLHRPGESAGPCIRSFSTAAAIVA